MTETYVGTMQLSMFANGLAVPISVEVAGKDRVVEQFQLPLLSAMFWLTAFKMVSMLLVRCVSRAWANCLPGFNATITTPAKIAMMPITTSNSIKVKPFIKFFFIGSKN